MAQATIIGKGMPKKKKKHTKIQINQEGNKIFLSLTFLPHSVSLHHHLASFYPRPTSQPVLNALISSYYHINLLSLIAH